MNQTPLQQFVIIAYDGADENALQRRMAVREAHLENARRIKQAGHFIEGGAILSEAGTMIGSVMIVVFPSRNELDTWLKNDPYVTGGVWQHIEIKPFRCAPV